ncbi:hypothetical protein PUNSTDRAFT_116641 [Punctularia strigosozonata HHB-11173 SS5]|uniref:GmrSD restriction endonucleases N-terminal domain-containing protein n=1 Tax=Punctularia strigosozonata (strain HHB-11173) TaxID=741275 RepID=R7S1T4_PUNST|nr:uncharacterized protein PUNSTDRAFT_116641 [Punctularia strigosozonata HHB-11173 SS5]EIN04183.1 hypothetical protein PUNSTDRAFT_116641 [Punctularia strigosozonata HHB-11173 SS5]
MDFDDWSDLSDLTSSDEEEYKPKGKAKTSKKQEYVVHGALRPPRTVQYTAKSLYDQIMDGSIDLDPEYQRDVVWTENKQSGLIDSILRNYYIPPIIFAVTSSGDGTESRVCIDGKQRLTSIQRLTGTKRWYKQIGRTKRMLLPKQYITKFANKQIVCVEYDGLDGDQEREIFQRVQLGVALTPAERMQAITGPWASFARELQNQIRQPAPDGFGDSLKWSSERGRDFQCICTVLSLAESWPAQGKVDSSNLEKLLERRTDPPAKLRAEVTDSFKIFSAIVADKKFASAFKKRLSPVEFTMTVILIYVHRKKLSITQLASAIDSMRKDVWSKYERFVRQNQMIVKHMSTFIKKIQDIELRSDGQGDTPAAKRPTNANAVASTKRRRVTLESEDEEEEVVKPLKEPPPAKNTTKAIPKARKSVKEASTSASTSRVTIVPKAERVSPKIPPEPKASKPQRAVRTGGPPVKAPPASAPPTPGPSHSAPVDEPMDLSTPVEEQPPGLQQWASTVPTAQPPPIQTKIEDIKRNADLPTPSPSLTPQPGDRSILPPSLTRLADPARPPASSSALNSPNTTTDPRRRPPGHNGPPQSSPSIPPPQSASAPPVVVKQEPMSEADMQARLNNILMGANLWTQAYQASQGIFPGTPVSYGHNVQTTQPTPHLQNTPGMFPGFSAMNLNTPPTQGMYPQQGPPQPGMFATQGPPPPGMRQPQRPLPGPPPNQPPSTPSRIRPTWGPGAQAPPPVHPPAPAPAPAPVPPDPHPQGPAAPTPGSAPPFSPSAAQHPPASASASSTRTAFTDRDRDVSMPYDGPDRYGDDRRREPRRDYSAGSRGYDPPRAPRMSSSTSRERDLDRDWHRRSSYGNRDYDRDYDRDRDRDYDRDRDRDYERGRGRGQGYSGSRDRGRDWRR